MIRASSCAIDAGHAEAHRGQRDVAAIGGAIDHGVQDLFDLELAFGLQVGGAGAAFAEDAAVGVGEQRDGLGPARIDPQDVHPTSLSASARKASIAATA